MAFSYNKKNLANTTITGAITPTQTSVTVADATVFSYAFFYATLMPSNEMSNASNSEIVLVTNIQGNTLTLVRGQENTIARSFPYGAVITNGIYTRDIDYARSIGRKVFMARDDGTDDTNTSYQIIDPMIKNVPEEGSIITVEFDTPSYGAPTLGVNNGIGGLVQVSGTNIHITDSSGQIDSVEMYGDTEQTTISGKNLANPEPLGYADMGITATYNTQTGEITLSGTATAGYSIPFRRVDQDIPAGTYTIKQYGNLSHGRMGINFRRADGTQITEYVVNTGTLENTFTLSEPAAKTYLFTLYHSAGQTVEGTVKFQFESGSSPTSFEPYVGGTASPNPDYPQEVQTVTGRQVVTISDGGSQSQEYEVNLGKNLLPFTNQNFTLKGVTFTVTNGTLYLNGTSEGETYANNQMFKDNFSFTLQPGTYILSRNNSHLVTAQIKKFSDGTTIASTNGTYTTAIFTLTEPTKVVFGFYMYQNVFDNVNLELMLEKGSTATTYAPYFTPIELCKIGTYQDYIYKSGEDWYVHKETGKIDLSSSTSWWLSGEQTAAVTQVAVWVGAIAKADDESAGYSNILGVETITEWGVRKPNLSVFSGNNYYVRISSSLATTAEQWQSYLSTHTMLVYYVLRTPTDTQITNSALIAQLEALYNMLPEGVADVVVTGDLPGSLTIKYYQQGTGTYTAPIVGGAEIDGGDNEQVVELDSYLPYRLVYDTNGYWRVLNKGPKVATGAIADGAVTAAKITRDNINYGTTSGDIRIGTFDGKPLWRRVQKFTNIPTGYSVHNWTAGTIANLNSIVSVNGMWAASGSTTYVPINSLPPDAVTTYGIAIRDFTASSWAVALGTSMNTVNSGYIILDYTKTS